MPRCRTLPALLSLALVILCALALPAAATQAAAAAPAGRCTQGDCVNGQGTFVDNEGITLEGSFTNGKLNGQGTRTIPDGRKYIGEFKDGLQYGQGTYTWPSGHKYVGEYKGGTKNGQGTFTFPNGEKYVGEFKDDKKNGQGTHTWPDGQKYVGGFKDDKKNGQGTHTWSDGEKYVGGFKDGEYHGQGTRTWPDGNKFVGEWRDDKKNGQGTHTWPTGEKYVGEFKDDKYHGQGTYTWPDGRKYVGEWRDDKREGFGIHTTPTGTVQRGIWANNTFVSALTEQEYAARVARADDQGAQASALAEEKAQLAAERQRLEEERANLASQKASTPNAPPSAKASAKTKAPAQQTRRVALVIGNGAYKEGPLKNPVNDAHDMAAALKALGFEVILRENASLAQMEGAVEEFWGKLKKGGAGLFYFAGHGLQVAGKNYLVPVDAKLSAEQDARYKCMDAGLVLGRMENAGNDLNLVILDACRNNPFARSWRSAEQGLAKMDAPRGSLIAYATAPDSVAADGQGRNGVYTEKLLRAIRTPGQPVELVFKRVRDEVMRATSDKQVPWESTSLRGDFYFTNP